MRVVKKILAIVMVIGIAVCVLYAGGYSFPQFFSSIEAKNPFDVFSPFISDTEFPDDTSGDNTSNDTNSAISTSNTSSGNTSQSGGWFPDDMTFSRDDNDEWFSSNKNIHINIGDNAFDLTKDTVVDFVKWLQHNFTGNEDIIVGTPNSSSNSNTSNGSTPDDTSSSINRPVVYNTILQSKEDLDALVNSIRVIDKLPNLSDYDRTTFESPVKSYTLNGKKINRNDYAWKTSKWFNEENFTYTCPYTGRVMYDSDDGKMDNDYGQLDYDHIVPLKSAYLRGAVNWTKEQQNEYAYNQWVGVDVLNSANRSKSDKGPLEYLPAINVEDYCYSWIMICSKYDLAMTQAEIDRCVSHINDAISRNEPVEFMGGIYE